MPEVLLPRSAEELLELTSRAGDYRLLAGGTDLLVWHRDKPIREGVFIGLERVPELRTITCADGKVVVGAAATFQQIADSLLVQRHLDVLCQAIRLLGSPPISHMATLGGNICTASPAGDSLPPLYVYGAQVELRSFRGNRLMPLAEFITGPRQTALGPEEVLWNVRVPLAEPSARGVYFKVGQRQALAIATVSLAALWTQNPDGTVRWIRLAWGSVGPTVLRFPDLEKALEGKPLALEVLRPLAEMVTSRVAPMNDPRASAAYRRRVAGNLLMKLAQKEWN
jgi:CO/xanthine dehydrogenase FAD-binding subunit